MTYGKEDFERIAGAIQVHRDMVIKYGAQFEAAAWFYLHRKRAFEGGRTPSQLKERLAQIERNARRLLKSLGIEEIRDAPDGPADREILQVLTYAPEGTEDLVVDATRRLGRLTEILEGIDAARVIERLASEAVAEVDGLAKSTLASGHVGDVELDNWVGDMMHLYQLITGKKPGRSVAAVGRPHEGISTGPLIRFLQSAARPLGLVLSEDAWGARIQRAQARARKRKAGSI